MLADPLFSRYPRIEFPNWNRRMEFWILSSLDLTTSICSKFHRFSTLTKGFSFLMFQKASNGAAVNSPLKDCGGLVLRYRIRGSKSYFTEDQSYMLSWFTLNPTSWVKRSPAGDVGKCGEEGAGSGVVLVN
ncbi:hypothetical protein AVEN_94593-1 [Araneus ventricosus]|uniref:Uncharacterized protein n=1 Tax=Araneus ventricosus TaxID=182803 RepID=A0A4Y2IM15_ARAVE|nr:hypothetical protein AVEN_94593-1 [Araneus ventricosus]